MSRFTSVVAGLFVLAGAVIACGSQEDAGSDEAAVINLSQAPMSKARLEAILAAHPEVKQLDQLPAPACDIFGICSLFFCRHAPLRSIGSLLRASLGSLVGLYRAVPGRIPVS